MNLWQGTPIGEFGVSNRTAKIQETNDYSMISHDEMLGIIATEAIESMSDQSNNAESKLDSWALVELLGRTRIVGHVTEATVAGGAFIQVNVPAHEGEPAFTRFYSPSAIYCISPITNAVAIELLKTCRNEPVSRYDIRQLSDKYPNPYGEQEEEA